MNTPVIDVRNLSKSYRLGTIGRHTLQEEIHYWWLKVRGQNPADYMGNIGHHGKEARANEILQMRAEASRTNNLFWALRDVSFTVNSGDVVGIIGRNGAGKSTLLKILSRITEPTYGEAFIEGRVGSLLEVGTGFHPDLTGRENIYMNGTILGMRKAEIDRKQEEIIAFAEIERFIDTPVKRYSSGMMVRLAFAVAAHLEPEILIVDEVLAVGDAQFQRKCLGKMGEVARHARTVLFVSHNMAAVENLCNRTIWIDEGKVRMDGDTSSVVDEYLRTTAKDLVERSWNDPATAPGNDKLRLCSAMVRPEAQPTPGPLDIETPIAVDIELLNLTASGALSLTVQIQNDQGTIVFSTNSDHPHRDAPPLPRGRVRFTCHIPSRLLNYGLYRVVLIGIMNQHIMVYRTEDFLCFDVKESPALHGDWFNCAGVTRPDIKWTITPASP